MKYAHTNIIAINWKKLVEFYTEVFQCQIVPPIRNQSGEWLEKGTGVKNAKLEGAHLLLPGHGKSGPTLEIFQYTGIENEVPISPNKRGFGHIAFEVEHVEDVLKQVIANGGSAFGEIAHHNIEGAGQITFTYARDPEGNLIELQSWTKETP